MMRMELGIFGKIFPRASVEEMLDAVGSYGIRNVHFNFLSARLDSIPDHVATARCRAIRQAFDDRGLSMCSISATYNTIHPDAALRAEMTRRACALIERCPELGTSRATLCTGTRCPDDMWTPHPDNRQQSAWDDLRSTLEVLLSAAHRAGVVLCVEPEHGNVICSAELAVKLLREFSSPHLKIVIDAANVIFLDNLPAATRELDKAFELLGGDIIMAHAKELLTAEGASRGVGDGGVPWRHYLKKLLELKRPLVLVLHGLEENDVERSARFLKQLSDSLENENRETRSVGARH